MISSMMTNFPLKNEWEVGFVILSLRYFDL